MATVTLEVNLRGTVAWASAWARRGCTVDSRGILPRPVRPVMRLGLGASSGLGARRAYSDGGRSQRGDSDANETGPAEAPQPPKSQEPYAQSAHRRLTGYSRPHSAMHFY